MVQNATPCNVVSWPKAVFTLSSVTREPIYIGSSTLRHYVAQSSLLSKNI